MSRQSASPSYQSPLQIYLHDINDTALLSADDERRLASRVATGDPYARDHMVKANLRLVVNIARGYLGQGLSLEDLIEEGNLGLMRAVEGFDGGMETRFSTYASYWIKQSIRRALINQGKPIRLTAYMVSLITKWKRTSAALAERLDRPPSIEEVGRALKLKEKKMAIVRKALFAHALNQVYGSDDEEGGFDLLGAQADELTTSAESRVQESDLWQNVLSQLEEMEETDRAHALVIRKRFGINDEATALTLKDAGKELGLCRERVRQIEYEGLVKLGMPEAPQPDGPSKSFCRRSNTSKNGKTRPQTPEQEGTPDQVLAAAIHLVVMTENARNVKARKASTARKQSTRRRNIDPTTCDRQQTEAEIELGKVMVALRSHHAGRLLTSREILAEAKRALGYQRTRLNGDEAADDAEAEASQFDTAMSEYKQRSGRSFPTWSEYLEVMLSLGFTKKQGGS